MADDIILLPDSAFFVKTADLPPGLLRRDCGDFADTILEDISPLPPEKLRRGYALPGGRMAIFASSADKAFGEGRTEESLKAAKVAAPAAALLAASNALSGVSCASFFKTADSLCLITSKGGAWEGFWSIPAGGDSESDRRTLLQMAESDGAELPESANGARVLTLESARWRRGKAVLEISDSSGARRSFSISARDAQACDVRIQNRTAESEKKRRTDAAILWAFRLAAAAFALLLCWQFYAWSLNSKVVELAARIGELQPKATAIEKLSEESARLSAFTGKKIHALQTIAKINAARPDEVSFVRAVFSSPAEVEIFGKAPALASVGEFSKKLKGMAGVSDVELKTERASNEAKFSMKVKFRK